MFQNVSLHFKLHIESCLQSKDPNLLVKLHDRKLLTGPNNINGNTVTTQSEFVALLEYCNLVSTSKTVPCKIVMI